MIYISAQPNTTYFAWQLEIQLRNFHVMGVDRRDIHVLIGYDHKLGLKKEFSTFIEVNRKYANFYCYPDFRKDFKYPSTIRPHLLKQHFSAYRYLCNEVFFYHDSDILFSRMPRINYSRNGACLVSDTRSYLDMNYVIRSGSEALLDEMLNVVGLQKHVLKREDRHTGGAQYILNGIKPGFWAKVEKDSEALYRLMNAYNARQWEVMYSLNKKFRDKHEGIQAWYADMWAVLWNLWYFGKKVRIHPELDFSWSYSPIGDWDRLAILHYSGKIENKDKYFKKTEYQNYMPWYDRNLDNIPNSNCSYEVVRLIKERRRELDDERLCLLDCSIVIMSDELSEKVLSTYSIIELYITKNLNINVFLFVQKNEEKHYRKDVLTKSNLASLIRECNQKRIICMPIDRLVDVNKVTELLSADIFSGYVQAYEVTRIYKIDKLFLESFSRVLEFELLFQNLGKFNTEEVNGEDFIFLLNICSDDWSEILLTINELLESKFNKRLRSQNIECQDLTAFNLI